jgi:phage-related tail fiber protein
MAYATLQKELTTPTTPVTGFIRFYAEGTALKYVDDTGTVYTIATGLTQEDVQDIVAGLITNSASITWNYNDAANSLTATVAASGVNHNALQNYVANQHIDHSAVSITAGTGLAGGGDITASRTIALANTTVTPGSYGSASSVATNTVDAQGRLTAAASVPIAVTASQVTDFTEAAQDAIGTALLDTASVDLVYNDVGNQISATVLPAGVNHNALQNYAANQHVDHSAVSVSAGTGLTGGGDLTASRTLSLANTAVVAGVYGSGTAVPVVTVDAQGRITNAGNNSIAIPASQVTDFAEAVDDRVAALVVAGAGVTATYNDVANTLTVASTITQYTDEQAQDAVGAALLDTASVNLTYNDAANQISADVLPAGVNHNALQNYVAAQHVDHSTVSIAAGTGLTGGGDISANRTLALANTAVTPGTYGSATNHAVVTVDAQGRLTAASNTPAALPSTQITDFTEAVQDVVGAFTSGNTGVSVTYNDAANTLAVALTSTGVGAGTYGSATNVPAISIDSQGRATSAANTPIAIPSTQVTDFAEAVQDVMGGAIVASPSVSWVYNDAANTQTATVVSSGVDHDATANFVADEHIAHSTVSISAGTGLTGGGTIAATRTLSLANTAVTPGTYGATTLHSITVDAQGRITVAANGPALALGDQFQRFEDLTTFTTTANTNQVAATFTTSALPAGLYRLGAYWTFANSSITVDSLFTWFLDGVQIGEVYRVELSETTNQRVPWHVFLYPTVTGSTTHTIELRVANETAGSTLSVFNVQVELWRVQ